MKRLPIITLGLIALLMSGSVYAQNATLEKFFNDYQEDERFTTVSVSSRMFGLFADFDMDDPAEAEFVEALSKLKGLKMIMGEGIDNSDALFSQAKRENAPRMEELMSVRDGGNEFIFYITEASGGTISEVMMIGHEKAQFMMMSLTGEIDLAQLARLSQKMDIEGFQHLQNLGEK